MKKLFAAISISLAFFMTFSTVSFAEETKDVVFTDVDIKTSEGEAILKMYNAGHINGYGDGTFRPDSYITRAELVKIINSSLNYTFTDEQKNLTMFSDVSENDWFYSYVKEAQKYGYLKGFEDGTFRPNENFTRQQMCAVLCRLFDFTKLMDMPVSDEISPWAKDYVMAITSNFIMPLEEGSKFRAVENITRGEVCSALAELILDKSDIEEKEEKEEKEETEKTTKDTDKKESSGSTSGRRQSSSGGSSSSSGGSSSSSKDETTETTTEDSVSDEILASLKEISDVLSSNVLPECSTDAQKDLLNLIISNMEAFIADNSYDIYKNAKEAKNMYYAMSQDEQEEFVEVVTTYVSGKQLLILKDYFF